MSTEIEWGYNCLTAGVHHGRPEQIWTMPLMQALHIFKPDELKELIVARIYNDAMQFVEHGESDHAITTPEWANQVKEYAENWFPSRFQQKVGELSNYYKSSQWRDECQDIIERVKNNKLNPHYAPLHPHDSINMLCRILGVSCSREASKDAK